MIRHGHLLQAEAARVSSVAAAEARRAVAANGGDCNHASPLQKQAATAATPWHTHTHFIHI